MTSSIVDANRLWRTTGRRDRFEVFVVVPVKTKRIDDIQTERRRALDRIAHHFRLRTYFRLVARAEVVASVVELGPDVVVVVGVNAFVVCVAAGIDVDGLNVVRVDVGIGFVVFGRDRR